MTRRQLISNERYPAFDRLIFAVFVLLVPLAIGGATKIFDDGDVSWHIAAGRWIMANGRVPTVDPFSFTMGGHPWVAFEWLSEMVYAAAFNAAGYAGLATLVTLAAMALHAIVFAFLRRRVGPVAMLVAIVAMDLILIKFVLARPHVLVWPVVAAWTAILLDRRDHKRAPPLVLAVLMLVWANLHGSFILGFAITAAVALDAIIAAQWNRRVITDWGTFGLTALLAALVNANGIAGLLHPITVMGLENLALIGEWQPSNPSQTPFFYAILIGTLGALLVRGTKLRVGELLLLLFLLAMSFLQVRNQSWLAIVAPLILAPRLAPGGRQEGPLADKRGGWIAAGAVAACLILAGRLALPVVPKENASNPRTLLAHIPAGLRAKPLFNEYTYGGPLILAGIRPYIDGRSDMYGDAFMADYAKIADGDLARFDRAVRTYGIRWAMLPPGMRLTTALDASPQWRRAYANSTGVIFVRQPTPARTGAPDSPPPRGGG